MIKVIAISIMGILTLSACASPAWRKPGVTWEDTKSAHSQCNYEIGLNKIQESKKRELINSCMEAKGFRFR
nr:hypothetical protein [uncultured bacterium]